MLASCDDVIVPLPSSRPSSSMAMVSERGINNQAARPAHQSVQLDPSASARPSNPSLGTAQPVSTTTEAQPKGRDDPSVSATRHEPAVSPRRLGQQRRERHAIRKPRPTQQAAAVQSSPPRRLLRGSARPTSKARAFPGQKSRKVLSESQNRERRRIGWSRSSRQGRCARSQQVTIEAEGPTRFGTTSAGSSVSARANSRRALTARPPTASRSPSLGSRSVAVWDQPFSRHDHRARRCQVTC